MKKEKIKTIKDKKNNSNINDIKTKKIKWNKNLKDNTFNASNGVFKAVKNELNLKLEIIFAILAIILGIALKVSKLELIMVMFSIALVIVTELINTAVEEVVDMKTTTYNNKIKYIKDVMAGAVLFSVFIAATTGFLVFFEKFWYQFCIICKIGY